LLPWNGSQTLAVILRRTTVILRRMTTVLSGVLDCGFILSGGACHGGNMGTLVFVCPATRGEVSTGIEMDLATLHQLELSTVHTADSSIPYWLAEVELLDSAKAA
jgi:hypothetical protein